jgi:hypothetical protein
VDPSEYTLTTVLPDTDIEVRVTKTGLRAVFALGDFMPGDVIFTWDTSTTFTDEEYQQLSAEQKAFVRRFDRTWTFMTEPICYVRHAVNGTAISRRGSVVAIKEIHAGEEITINFDASLG